MCRNYWLRTSRSYHAHVTRCGPKGTKTRNMPSQSTPSTAPKQTSLVHSYLSWPSNHPATTGRSWFLFCCHMQVLMERCSDCHVLCQTSYGGSVMSCQPVMLRQIYPNEIRGFHPYHPWEVQFTISSPQAERLYDAAALGGISDLSADLWFTHNIGTLPGTSWYFTYLYRKFLVFLTSSFYVFIGQESCVAQQRRYLCGRDMGPWWPLWQLARFFIAIP